MDTHNEPIDQPEPNEGRASQDQRLSILAERVSALAGSLDAQQDKLRDYEKSLVERIADVDDDRRSTATKLQRAWQSQREEIDGRLRRQSRITAGALIGIALVVSATFLALLRQAEPGPDPLLETTAALQAEVLGLRGKTAALEPMQEELTRLDAVVGELSTALAGLGESQQQTAEQKRIGETADRTERDARMREQLGLLQAGLQRITRELESIRETAMAPRPAVVAVPADETPAAAPEGPKDGTPATRSEEAKNPPAGQITLDAPRYALQLIGFYSMASLRQFSRRQDLPAQAYVREESFRRRPWYVLIHSLHDSRAAAREELSRLPADLAQLDTWIRPIPEGATLQVLNTRDRQ
jgi:DamX protein